jgi:hypothetical protein
VHVRSGGNFISSERIGNVAFMFRATEVASARNVHSSSSSSSFHHFAHVSWCFLREVLCSGVAFTSL